MNKKTLTEKEFSEISPKIESVLHSSWREEQENWINDAPSSPKNENDIWSALPNIDSKTAVVLAAKLEEKIEWKVSEDMIKKGGYETIGDLIKDFLNKIYDKYVKKIKVIAG